MPGRVPPGHPVLARRWTPAAYATTGSSIPARALCSVAGPTPSSAATCRSVLPDARSSRARSTSTRRRGRPIFEPRRRAASMPAFVRSTSRVLSCSATQLKIATRSDLTGEPVSSHVSRTLTPGVLEHLVVLRTVLRRRRRLLVDVDDPEASGGGELFDLGTLVLGGLPVGGDAEVDGGAGHDRPTREPFRIKFCPGQIALSTGHRRPTVRHCPSAARLLARRRRNPRFAGALGGRRVARGSQTEQA